MADAPRLTDRQRRFLGRVLEAIEGHAVDSPTPRALALELGAPFQAIDEILRLGHQTGSVLCLEGGLWYTPLQIARIQRQTREKFGTASFGASEFRDAFGTTRRYAAPLLDYFDATGFTLREKGLRRIASRE